MSNRNKLLIYSTGMVFYLACQWLTIILVSNLSGNTGAGIYNLAISISNPFSAIALYGIRPYQVSDINDRFSSRIYVSSRVVTAGLAFLLCAGRVILGGYTGEAAVCILLYMLLRIAEAAVDVFQGIEQKGDRMDAVGVSFYLRAVVTIVAFVAGQLLFDNLMLSMLAMPLASFVVIWIYDGRLSRKLADIRPQFDWRAIGQLLWICLPLTLNTYMVSELATIPKTVLESSWGSDMLGIYGSIAAPSIIVQTAGSFLFNPVIPALAEDLQQGERKRFFARGLKYTALISAMTVVCVVGAAIFGRFGLRILFAGNLSVLDYADMLIPTIVCSGLVTVAWLFATLLIVMRDFKSLIVGDVLAIGVCHLASRLLIPEMGMGGVTLSWGIALMLQALVFVAACLWRMKRQSS
ncbi:MAG: lipopolysaccharide biosynthesis protein [Lachnospiraceae bacterium]|nr:lipopolysaccharide biosynthesis protein [Lachnospiraceae bacterium]